MEEGFVEDFGGEEAGVGLHPAGLLEAVDDFGGGVGDFGAAGAVDLVHREEDAGEAGHGAAVFRGEVGAAVEGFALGGEEDGHGPAALAGDGLYGLHVDAVDIGALFAVNFDVDEAAVHHAGDGGVFEGFALHDMAPVAGGVADAEEDGLVFVAGLLEGFRPPGEPVDGVVGVLEEVGAGFVGESVGHGASIVFVLLCTKGSVGGRGRLRTGSIFHHRGGRGKRGRGGCGFGWGFGILTGVWFAGGCDEVGFRCV